MAAPTQSSPSQFGITKEQLVDIMEHRGEDGILKLNQLGGMAELCRKLGTSPVNGKFLFISVFQKNVKSLVYSKSAGVSHLVFSWQRIISTWDFL